MSTKSKIEWLVGDDGQEGTSWNLTVGCQKTGKGCDNCYAIPFAHRLAASPNPAVAEIYKGLTRKSSKGYGLEWTGLVKTVPERLEEPLHWKKPRKVFVDSMSDLFHKDVPFEFIDKALAVMALCQRHTFIILTKRPDRMREYFSGFWQDNPKEKEPNAQRWDDARRWLRDLLRTVNPQESERVGIAMAYQKFPIPNVWCLFSAWDQESFEKGYVELAHTPAAVRGVSLEPLLGPVDLVNCQGEDHHFNPLTGEAWDDENGDLTDDLKYARLDWVIVGGESGGKARPSDLLHILQIRDDCGRSGTPFFFKQWGKYRPCQGHEGPGYSRFCESYYSDGMTYLSKGMWAAGKKEAGRVLDGRTWDGFPEVKS
ncbi:MAG: DUF5131 family protein [Bdellovibrionota bacterium]